MSLFVTKSQNHPSAVQDIKGNDHSTSILGGQIGGKIEISDLEYSDSRIHYFPADPADQHQLHSSVQSVHRVESLVHHGLRRDDRIPSCSSLEYASYRLFSLAKALRRKATDSVCSSSTSTLSTVKSSNPSSITKTVSISTIDQTAEDMTLGQARLGYNLIKVCDGIFSEHQMEMKRESINHSSIHVRHQNVSLLIFEFSFKYDETCTITNADICITFGSDCTEKAGNPPLSMDIIPLATDHKWHQTFSGSGTNLRVCKDVKWNHPFAQHNTSLEPTSPQGNNERWRIAGSPLSNNNQPSSQQRGYLWQVSGNELSRHPIPEKFSLGMIVQHDMVDYRATVQIKGQLRGQMDNGLTKVANWRPKQETRWMLHPQKSNETLDGTVLGKVMKRRYMGIGRNIH